MSTFFALLFCLAVVQSCPLHDETLGHDLNTALQYIKCGGQITVDSNMIKVDLNKDCPVNEKTYPNNFNVLLEASTSTGYINVGFDISVEDVGNCNLDSTSFNVTLQDPVDLCGVKLGNFSVSENRFPWDPNMASRDFHVRLTWTPKQSDPSTDSPGDEYSGQTGQYDPSGTTWFWKGYSSWPYTGYPYTDSPEDEYSGQTGQYGPYDSTWFWKGSSSRPYTVYPYTDSPEDEYSGQTGQYDPYDSNWYWKGSSSRPYTGNPSKKGIRTSAETTTKRSILGKSLDY